MWAIIGLLFGLAAGVMTMALPVAFPDLPQLWWRIFFFGGLIVMAACLTALIWRIRMGKITIRNLGGRVRGGTAIKLNGRAELDADGVFILGGEHLLDMDGDAKAKLRNVYHDRTDTTGNGDNEA